MARNKKTGISDKQETFCQEYLKDKNAKQAYIRAGYAKKTAEVGSCKLVSKVKIRARIDFLMAEPAKKLNITRESQLLKLQTIVDDKDCTGTTAVSAIREMNDMLGYHREAAPNPEAEAARKQRLDEETQALREQAKERIRIISIKDAG